MTQCWEEVADLIGTSNSSPTDRWTDAKKILGNDRVTLGPVASHSWLHQPEHIAFQIARYRAAAALIGDAERVAEIGCGEGIGAGILAKGRREYAGLDPDREAFDVADAMYAERPNMQFDPRGYDWLDAPGRAGWFDAMVSLDVIEHIPADREADFMVAITNALGPDGVLVIGTPSANAAHLASPQSQAGHVNLYTPERIGALMARHFRVVQMLYMQDVSIHLGHPGMAHYILAVGIGPKGAS